MFIEVMLNYQPVWEIMGKITEYQYALTDEFILETVFPREVIHSDTNSIKSKPLKRWKDCISEYTGTPICFKTKVHSLLFLGCI